MSKTIKKGDLVKITTDDGHTRIVRVDRVNPKTIKGDAYDFEKKYVRGDACSYKVKDKNVTIDKAGVEKIEGQLMQSNLRVKVENDQIKEVEEVKEEKINTGKRGKRTKRSTSNKRKSNSPAPKMVKDSSGRRVVSKRGNKAKRAASKKEEEAKADVDMSNLTDAEKLKLEMKRIREEKKKETQRKRMLKKVNPNPDVEEIEINPLLQPTHSKKIQDFPLEGCSKFSDNRKAIFLYQQSKG